MNNNIPNVTIPAEYSDYVSNNIRHTFSDISTNTIDNKLLTEKEIKSLIQDSINPPIVKIHIGRLKGHIRLKLIDAQPNQFIPELNGYLIKVENNHVYIKHD